MLGLFYASIVDPIAWLATPELGAAWLKRYGLFVRWPPGETLSQPAAGGAALVATAALGSTALGLRRKKKPSEESGVN